MKHKRHQRPGPIPAGNRSRAGRKNDTNEATQSPQDNKGAPFQEQDPKRRLGDFSGAGEHPYQQPGGLNDANH